MTKEQLFDVYLSLGSNLGSKEENIKNALRYIQERIGEIASSSAFYITEPLGFESDNMFVNIACHIRTSLSPIEVLEATQAIETEMGRLKKSVDKQYADRIIDIDILLYGDLVMDSEGLIIPHPSMHERAFVLDPLKEIASEVMHPVLNKTIGSIDL